MVQAQVSFLGKVMDQHLVQLVFQALVQPLVQASLPAVASTHIVFVLFRRESGQQHFSLLESPEGIYGGGGRGVRDKGDNC